MPRNRGQLRRNVHIPYINIQFNSFSLSWRGDENRPDYFTSLTHKRKVDEANNMKIDITYCPKIGEDPNKVEKAILANQGTCLVQYGDLASNTSRLYKAAIVNYTVQLDNGVLRYSFDLISHAVAYNEGSTVPGGKQALSSGDGDTIDDVIDQIKLAASIVKERYDLDDEGSIKSVLSDAEFTTINLVKGSPFKYIMNILAQLKSSTEGVYYALDIDDACVDKGKVRVVRVDSNEVSVTYNFEWGTRDGTVLDWSPNFKGSVALANLEGAVKAGGVVSDKPVSVTSQVDVDTGEIVTAQLTELNKLDIWSTDSYEVANKLLQSNEDFKKLVNYNYGGTLTTLGEGGNIVLASTVIKINPIIMGQSHHSAGLYMVNGVTDSVSSSGFTTTFDVLRRQDADAGLYKKEEYNTNQQLWVNGVFISYDEYSKTK